MSKNIKYLMAALLFLLMIGCSSSPKKQETVEADNQATLEKTCRTEKSVGSKLVTKKCKTAKEWAEYDKRKEREMRDASRRISSGQSGSK